MDQVADQVADRAADRVARRRQRRMHRAGDTGDVPVATGGLSGQAWRRPGAAANAHGRQLDLAAALAEARRQIADPRDPPDDPSGEPTSNAMFESNGVSVTADIVQRAENARRLVVGIHRAMKDQGASRWVYPLPTNVQSWLAGKVAEQSSDMPRKLPLFVQRHVNGHADGVTPFKQHATLLLDIAIDVRKHARGLNMAQARPQARSAVDGKQGTTVDDVLNEVERVHDTLQQRSDAIQRMRRRFGKHGISRRDAALGLGAVGALGAGALGAALLRRWRQKHI